MSWKITIVDDHQIVVDGLSRIVNGCSDFELLFTASNGKELMETLTTLDVLPDVILMDVDMPVMNGIETSKLIKKEYPAIKVLILSMHNEGTYYNKAVSARADGFIPKSIKQSDLIKTLQRICTGEQVFSQKGKSNRIEPQIAINAVPLTIRETEILKKIALGLSNSEISKVLGISIRTVDNHRTNLKKKLDVNGIAGLVRYALNVGIIT